MKIVIAPDSFKGSISAKDICTSVKRGILRVFPNADVIEIPLADGGEGTMENMVYATNGSKRKVEVTGPLGHKVSAEYGVLGDNETVVIEMAQASGLTLLQEHERNPLVTTSFGTGELIKAALDEGYRKMIIGIGGSATNDGGMGMLKALGVKFHKKDGSQLSEGGASLKDLDRIDAAYLDPRVKESTIMIASDVTNPLCGSNGASAIFGPQKGATPEMVKALDEGLDNFSKIVHTQKSVDMRELIGGGAAGGLGATLITFLEAELHSGVQVIMEKLRFEDQIKDADLIITGEGRLDSQTLSGKLINGVSKMAGKHEIPIIALCGGLDIEISQLVQELGLLSAFSIAPGPCTLEEAMVQAADWISERVEAIMRIIKF